MTGSSQAVMKVLVYVMCLAFTGVSADRVLKASETSKKVLDLISYFGGDYDNKEQIQKAGDKIEFVQLRLIPVDIPCLRPDPVIFVEQATNGVIMFFDVAVVKDGIGDTDPVIFVEQATNGVIMFFDVAVVKDGIGDTVSLTIYNFTDYTKYKPGEFNVEKLSNISRGDLQGDGGCIATFRDSSKGFLLGNYPQCRLTENGKYALLTIVHTCNSSTVTYPINTSYKSHVEPYEYRIRQKHPLINPPNDYVAPCGN